MSCSMVMLSRCTSFLLLVRQSGNQRSHKEVGKPPRTIFPCFLHFFAGLHEATRINLPIAAMDGEQVANTAFSVPFQDEGSRAQAGSIGGK